MTPSTSWSPAVIGPLQRPEAIVVGLHNGDELRIVGRSTPLQSHQARQPGTLLRPPSGPHRGRKSSHQARSVGSMLAVIRSISPSSSRSSQRCQRTAGRPGGRSGTWLDSCDCGRSSTSTRSHGRADDHFRVKEAQPWTVLLAPRSRSTGCHPRHETREQVESARSQPDPRCGELPQQGWRAPEVEFCGQLWANHAREWMRRTQQQRENPRRTGGFLLWLRPASIR